MKKILTNKKGFTLIELIAVLIILSVMFAIIVPKFISFDKNAEQIQQTYQDNSIERRNVFQQYGGDEPLISNDPLIDGEEK